MLKRNESGKYVLEFDEIPQLLFVSEKGEGSTDKLYIRGKFQGNVRNLTLHSDVDGLTTYITERYVMVTEDGKVI